MTSNEHKKHTKLARPTLGTFGRNEWAIVGTSCAAIKALATEIMSGLAETYNCIYIDAKHTTPGEKDSNENGRASVEIMYKSNGAQIEIYPQANPFEIRKLCNHADLVLVNGNHYEATSQVLVIDETKRESLQRKLAQLTRVQLILFTPACNQLFNFLHDALPHAQQLPAYKTSDTGHIIHFFKQQVNSRRAPLYGLVLAGGKSVRMGADKPMMKWHGKEQQYHMADLLQPCCEKVFISCRADQQESIDSNYQPLPDTFIDLGPYGALLSAFRAHPDAAFLVVAADLPLMDNDTLLQLINSRNTSSIATAFSNPHDTLPEPLVAIWEPKSYAALLSFLALGYSCPRKVLMNSEVTLITAANSIALMNVNTPEDAEHAKAILVKQTNSIV